MDIVHFHFFEIETSFSTPVAPLPLSEKERALIVANWQRVNAEGHFFNGPVLAATAIDVNGAPGVSVSTTDYAHYLYANAHPTATPCHIVYCAAAIVTSDNYVLFGEMNSSTSSPGQLQFVGGNVEIAPDGSISGRHCCEREVIEEIGAAFLEMARDFRPLCIKTGGKADHVGIYYVLHVNATKVEAQAAFDAHLAQLRLAGEKPELVKVHFVELTQSAITQFFHQNSERCVDYLAPLLTDHGQVLRR